jgi:uroporphyrinogen decarboxylase
MSMEPAPAIEGNPTAGSKERVMRAVGHEQPDRTPFDFAANASTQRRLMQELRCSTHRELLNRLRVDIVDLRGVVDPVYRGPIPYARDLPGGVTENFWGWRTKVMSTATGPEVCYCDFVLSGCESIEELAVHPWPSPDWFDFGDFADRLEPWRDLAIMASGASVWQHPSFLRGLDQLMMDLIADAEMAGYMLDRFTDFYVEYFRRMFEAAPGLIDILRIADDLGTQGGLLMSPEMFEQFIAPRVRRLVELAHAHDVAVMFHSCGAIRPLLAKLIDTGIDILDPIQVTAEGMDPAAIYARTAGRLCLHGSIDTQQLLPRGEPETIVETAESRIAQLGMNGGLILAPSHVLQTDVPTRNVIALYDEVVR